MGLLLERDLTNTPRYKDAVDLIGLWSAKTDHFNGEFYALMRIDTITNLVELTRIDTKSSDAIARKFKNTWLLNTQDRQEYYMTTVANSQGMTLPAFSVLWELRIFPQPTKIHSLMPYAKVCIRQWQQC